MLAIISAIGGKLLKIGESLLPMIGHGVPEVVAAAKEAGEAIGKIKEIEGIDNAAALDDMQKKLEAAVFAHADKTLSSLE